MATKSTTTSTKRETVKKVSLDEMIDVQSCVVGKLIWTSPRTSNKTIWNECGEINPISVAELMEMRNVSRGLFELNLIVLCGPRAEMVLKYLQVDKFYKDVKNTEDIDEIFKSDPSDIKAIVSKLAPGVKDTVCARARELIKSGAIDSYRVITAIEEATGCRFSE